MKRTSITEPILYKETMKQKERFEKLYGPGDYSALISKNTKHTRWQIASLLLLIILILFLQTYKSSHTKHGMTLDHNGNLASVERPNNGSEAIVLNAAVFTDSGKLLTNQGIKIVIAPLQTEKQINSIGTKEIVVSDEERRQQEIRSTVYQLNSDPTNPTVALPQKMHDGTRIYWVPQKSQDGWITLFVLIIGCYAIYTNRLAGLTKIEKAARESVLRELPEFVNKLLLLLNAGLVMGNAFYKIVADYKRIKGGENNYFYNQLAQITMKCSETNGSIQHEIRSFAVRTGVVEFMRLSNIINDSMTKGSDLMAQLSMEVDCLWAARRKQIEEKGKLAETKLTFPLVILLLVLLMITITPAMMEM
jgi:tight adherence protein C